MIYEPIFIVCCMLHICHLLLGADNKVCVKAIEIEKVHLELARGLKF